MVGEHEQIRELQSEVRRLERVNEVLMNRVESSTDAAGSSYSLFESNLVLQNKINQHTGRLVEINHALQQEIGLHKKTESALRFERNFVDAVLEAAGALIIVLDRDGRIVRFNRKCERVTGYSFQEVKEKPIWNLLPPDQEDDAKRVINSLGSGELSSDEDENCWVSKTGERRRIAWSNTTLTGDRGDVEFIIGIGIDITAIREAEEKLKLYQRIYSASSDGITIIKDGVLVARNPAHRELSGFSDEDVIGKPMSEFLDESEVGGIYQSIIDRGLFRGELKVHRKDGGSRHLDISVFPIRNDAGEIVYHVGMGRDITRLKQDQEALATRLRYEIGLAGCSQILLETGAKDEIIPKALRHLLRAADAGRVYIFENFDDSEGELCARHRYEVCTPGVEPTLEEPALQHMSYKEEFDNYPPWREFLGANKPYSGHTRQMSPDLQEILKGGGVLSLLVLPIWVNQKWYGFIGFDEVRTEREWGEEELRLLRTAAEMIGGYVSRWQADEALQVSEERFRNLVENANEVIYSLDPGGKCAYLSPKFEELSGYKVGEFIGRPVTDLMHPEDAPGLVQWLADGAVKGARRTGYEWRLMRKDGEIRWFISNSSVMRDAEQNIIEIVGVAHDITEMKTVLQDLSQAYQNLRETQAQLVQHEKMASLGMLVAGIAHEINTPIGSVSSMHDTLMKAMAKLGAILGEGITQGRLDNQRIQPLLEMIDDANRVICSGTERVTTIVRRLRSFARLDEAELKEVDLHEGIEDTLSLVHHEIKHHITVHREFGDLPKISCFPGRLNQVFVNLLINAKQAIPEKGEIWITTSCGNGKLSIRFRDSGVGIPPEKLEKIFDPGFTTKGVGVGTGLGLSICYQIIQDHHGEILVKSEVGKGSEFTILLPTNLEKILNQSLIGD